LGRKYNQYATTDKVEKINIENKELIRKYFVFKNMNLSEASKKSYESDYNQWLVYIMENYNNRYLLDFETDDAVDMIEDFIAFCTSVLENNERRIQRRMSSISSFYLFLRKKRRIKENPVDFLDRPKVGKGEKLVIKQTFLSEEQIDKIRKGLKELDNLQLELWFEFGLSTMARVNAISNVKIKQINFENNCIEDVLEKEGYSVTLFPSPRCFELINKWIKYREETNIDCEYLFITKHKGEWRKADKSAMQSTWIKKIGNLINIPELHCHDLRHSGSSILYNKGMPLETVSHLLNHKGTDVTKDHYIKQDIKKIQDEKAKFEI